MVYKRSQRLPSDQPPLWFSNEQGLTILSSGPGAEEHFRRSVIFRLIPTEANKELLLDVPSIPFLDLSLVFYLFLAEQKQGHIAALIHNHHMKSWNLDSKQLYKLASENTPRLLPPKLQLMGDLIQEMYISDSSHSSAAFPDILSETDCQTIKEASDLLPLYVLTNRTGACGACACLYPHVLKNFANLLNQDLLILPSSIHEVLILPDDKTYTVPELSRMVFEINRTEVPVHERLSDHVYAYSRKEDRIFLSAPERLSS